MRPRLLQLFHLIFVAAAGFAGPSCLILDVDPGKAGAFPTLQAAIDSVPFKNTSPVCIRIAPVRYEGRVEIPKGKDHLFLLGTGPDREAVVITAAPAVDQKTLAIHGDDVWLENFTVENTAGSDGGPNGAVFSDAHHLIAKNLLIKGWQDTLPLWMDSSSFFQNCTILGSVDFIYGAGTAVFKDCEIVEIRVKGGGPITAPNTPASTPYGFVFLGCRIVRGDGVPDNSISLMRPWGDFASVTFIDCIMDGVRAKGLEAWDGRWRGQQNTIRASEYGSRTKQGSYIDLTQRVPWVRILTAEEASRFTPPAILSGWNPEQIHLPDGVLLPGK